MSRYFYKLPFAGRTSDDSFSDQRPHSCLVLRLYKAEVEINIVTYYYDVFVDWLCSF